MKITIDITKKSLKRYEELEAQRKLNQKDMQERIKLYKGNIKKVEKDLIYKRSSYEFVIAGIEQNDIRDKVFASVQEAYLKSKGDKNEN